MGQNIYKSVEKNIKEGLLIACSIGRMQSTKPSCVKTEKKLNDQLKEMARSRIERIREKVRRRQHDMSAHAMEEMVEDGLDIEDVESAILNGRITRIERDDPRGTKYVVEGIGADGLTPVGVVGRFTSTGRYLIITVYEISILED